MHCAACDASLDAFTGDVCPECHHFAHPTRLGIYDDLELIKRGGMGCVYRARHPDLGTVVAIKTVQTHTGPATVAERFQREARLAAKIPHPGVVRVLDHDSQEGRLYLVMEFVAGVTLRQPIEDGDKSFAWKIDTVTQLADILLTAHDRGIVHRDIKPENVMVDTTGRVRVLDFGIATILEEEDRLTQTGEILGTPEYIAPEQILDVPEAVDARTDVYAVGVVLYELLTGVSPFAGGNLFQVLKNVESREPPPPSTVRPGVSPAADALVMDCIAKDPGARPANAGELAQRLRALPVHDTPPLTPAQPRSRAPAILAGLCIGGLCVAGGFLGGRASSPPVAAPSTASGPATEPPPSPYAAMQRILGEPGAPNRPALTAAVQALGTEQEAESAYWRGRGLRASGALLAAEQAFAEAVRGGFSAAAVDHAALQIFRRRLLISLLPGGSESAPPFALELPGDSPLIRGMRALAQQEDQLALKSLREIHEPQGDAALLSLFAESLQTDHRVTPARIDAVAPRHDIPAALLHARIATKTPDRTKILETALRPIDRWASTRYLLELVIAGLRSEDRRLRASLELCLVVGASDFPVLCYTTTLVHRYSSLNAPTRTRLRKLIRELPAELTVRLRARLETQELTHGK